MTPRSSGRIEKTVFISYRRATGAVWALAISKDLTHHGYDVFFDFQGIASGDFEQIIVQNITARAHFLVLLTPSALEHVDREGDWLRREIEAGLEHRRNIIPLMLDGFDFSTPSIRERLTGTLAPLKGYNGLTVPVDYFDEAMQRLRTRHLNIPVEAVLHPPSAEARAAASEQQEAANAAPSVAPTELTAEQWFERGYEAASPDEQIFLYTQAITLKPDLAPAYCNRGNAYYEREELDRALADYTEFIRLRPHDSVGRVNRGNLYDAMGEFDRAIADYDECLRAEFSPEAYLGRAKARKALGQYWSVIGDLSYYLEITDEDGKDKDKRVRVAALLDEMRSNPPENAKSTEARRNDGETTGLGGSEQGGHASMTSASDGKAI